MTALLLALLLYACFGSPTPERFGWPEVSIALLLVGAVGTASALRPLGIGKAIPSSLAGGQALLLYGLLCPVIGGVLQGSDPAIILRDVIPFLFFLLPLFCVHLAEDKALPGFLIPVAIFAGLCFALRDLARIAIGFANLDFLSPMAADPLSYLANAPTVLFAALMLIGSAGRLVLEGRALRDFLLAALCLALALVPLAVMGLTLQRASFGLALLVTLVWLAAAFVTNPLRAFRLLVPLALMLLATLPVFENVLGLMLEKTQSVGLNSRVEEVGAIWREVSGSPLTLLFGLGWGAGFASPAVGGLHVHFAHSLPAAMLLKTGLAGVILSGLYLAGFVMPLLRLLRRDLVLALALAAPVAIDSLLYAAYKSLDYGVMLLIVWAASSLRTPAHKL
jgi:hypothetical protein